MQVIFYKSKYGDWWDKLVTLVTGDAQSHCELAFTGVEDPTKTTYFSSSPRDGGVRFKQMEIDPEHWDTIELSIDKEQEHKIREWCVSQTGMKYNWLGALGLPFRSKHRWYCSEICATALNLDTNLNLNLETKTTPGYLYCSLVFKSFKRTQPSCSSCNCNKKC